MKDKIQIICVEDESVDIDELQNIQDGKVLVYRQGSQPPFVLEIEKSKEQPKLDVKAFLKDYESLICRFAYSCDRDVVHTVIAEYEKLLKFYGVENER